MTLASILNLNQFTPHTMCKLSNIVDILTDLVTVLMWFHIQSSPKASIVSPGSSLFVIANLQPQIPCDN